MGQLMDALRQLLGTGRTSNPPSPVQAEPDPPTPVDVDLALIKHEQRQMLRQLSNLGIAVELDVVGRRPVGAQSGLANSRRAD
jgi:hypothetical protein